MCGYVLSYWVLVIARDKSKQILKELKSPGVYQLQPQLDLGLNSVNLFSLPVSSASHRGGGAGSLAHILAA